MEIKMVMGERHDTGFTMSAYAKMSYLVQKFASGEIATGAYILDGKPLALASLDLNLAPVSEVDEYDDAVEDDEEVIELGLDEASIVEALHMAEAKAAEPDAEFEVVSEDIAEAVETIADLACTKQPLTFIKVVTQ